MLNNIKIARVSTVAFFVDTQLHQQMQSISEAGMDLTVIASEPQLDKPLPKSHYHSIQIPRSIHPIKDLKALWQLWRFFKNNPFQIVHSTTPKAGLLCAIAAKLAGVPVRIHTFTGQPWVTLTGIKKQVAILADKIIIKLNSHCYTDSASQRDFLEQQGIASTSSLKVIHHGSLAGVDTNRFNPDSFSAPHKLKLKQVLNISEEAIVFLFVGRIVKDKGVMELFEAFQELLIHKPNSILLMVGPNEMSAEEKQRLPNTKNIIFAGYQLKPEKFMSIANVLCLPSYREGFGTVIIEAAAMEVPAIASDIYGLRDAVQHQHTGLLIPPQNSNELFKAMLELSNRPDHLNKLGKNARIRAVEDFDEKLINQKQLLEYEQLIAACHL